MNINPEEKTETLNLSDELLRTIVENCYRPKHITNYQKMVDEKRENLVKKFCETLDEDQKKMFDELESLNLDYGTTDQMYNILYGMKIKRSLEIMTETPIEAIKHFQKDWKVK